MRNLAIGICIGGAIWVIVELVLIPFGFSSTSSIAIGIAEFLSGITMYMIEKRR